MLNGDLKHT